MKVTIYSVSPPTNATEVRCKPNRKAPRYGAVACNGTLLRSKCEFSCITGFGFIDTALAVTTCVEDGDDDAHGYWEPNVEPTCIGKYKRLSFVVAVVFWFCYRKVLSRFNS